MATLTFLVKGGKTRAKLEVDLDSEPAPPSSSSPISAPLPRGHRRHQTRGAPQQGAPSRSPHQEGEAGRSPRPTWQPLKHPPPAPDGRQAILTVGRPTMPPFAILNMDGSHPSLPPRLVMVGVERYRWQHCPVSSWHLGVPSWHSPSYRHVMQC